MKLVFPTNSKLLEHNGQYIDLTYVEIIDQLLIDFPELENVSDTTLSTHILAYPPLPKKNKGDLAWKLQRHLKGEKTRLIQGGNPRIWVDTCEFGGGVSKMGSLTELPTKSPNGMSPPLTEGAKELFLRLRSSLQNTNSSSKIL